MLHTMSNFRGNALGSGGVEYGMLVALIGLVCMAAVTLTGETVETSFDRSGGSVGTVAQAMRGTGAPVQAGENESDTNPDPFNIPAMNPVRATAVEVESAPFTVTGFDDTLTMSVSGGFNSFLRVNGADMGSSAEVHADSDSIVLVSDAPTFPGSSVTLTVALGSHGDTAEWTLPTIGFGNVLTDDFSTPGFIDALASSGETHDATSGSFSSTAPYEAGQDFWDGGLASYLNWSGNSFSKSGTFAGAFDRTFWDSSQALLGQFSVDFDYVDGSGYAMAEFGIGSGSYISTLSGTADIHPTAPFVIYFGGATGNQLGIKENGTAMATLSVAKNSHMSIRRNASDHLEVVDDGSVVYTSVSTYDGAQYPAVSVSFGSAAVVYRNVEIENFVIRSSGGPMTLVSSPISPDTQPTLLRVSVTHENVGNGEANSDFSLSATCSASWKQANLVKTVDLGNNLAIWEADIDVSDEWLCPEIRLRGDQSAGTSGIWHDWSVQADAGLAR